MPLRGYAPRLIGHLRRKLPSGKSAWNAGLQFKKKVKWQKTNKVGDAMDPEGQVKRVNANNFQSGVVNIILYVGFGLVALGLILVFVGMGSKGFKTKELQSVGPSLIGSGLIFIVLRLLFCSCTCKRKNEKQDKMKQALAGPRRSNLKMEPAFSPSIKDTPLYTVREVQEVSSEREVTGRSARSARTVTSASMPNYIYHEEEIEEAIHELPEGEELQVMFLNNFRQSSGIRLGTSSGPRPPSAQSSSAEEEVEASKTLKPEDDRSYSASARELVLDVTRLGQSDA